MGDLGCSGTGGRRNGGIHQETILCTRSLNFHHDVEEMSTRGNVKKACARAV